MIIICGYLSYVLTLFVERKFRKSFRVYYGYRLVMFTQALLEIIEQKHFSVSCTIIIHSKPLLQFVLDSINSRIYLDVRSDCS